MLEQNARAEGVGVTYHPFLHGALLAQRDAFDFVELPLDLYIDPARAALLDPAGARLEEIAAAKPCIWRGSALSLGSVESTADPSPDPRTIDRIRQLMAKAGAMGYSDVIGFRRLGESYLGFPQSMPYTETAARWIGARYAAARDALGRRFWLQLSPAAFAGPPAGLDAAAFLCRISAHADCEFVLDVADLARFAAEAGTGADEMARLLPGTRIGALVTSGEREEDWALLSFLSGRVEARSIVIRRNRHLFPLDAIGRTARRAGELLAGRRGKPPVASPAPAPLPADPEGLADLRAYEMELIQYCLDPPEGSALATSVQGWQVWRKRLEETYKAQQISQFLAADAGS